MTAQVLSRLGYEPVEFSDSHAALAAFEAAPRSFDVVVTDDVMPGLSGTGLASLLRQLSGTVSMLGAACHIAGNALAFGVSRNLGCHSRNSVSRRPSSSAHRT
jgi:CheY-like chemotaxis protein